jgi:hypothetical protein
MKKNCISDSEDPGHLINEISNIFEKKALKGFHNKFKIESVGLSRYKKYFYLIED